MSGSHIGPGGLVLTGEEWLDAHFAAMEPEYLAMVQAAGICPGFRVLDAGCGTGPFLPFLRQLVGIHGVVHAVDASPANVRRVEGRVAREGWTNVTVGIADLRDGGVTDTAYDVIWCANVTQYLADLELSKVLSGWRRSLRPGGRLAIKEFDISRLRLDPLPEGLIGRWHAARCAAGDAHAMALDRTPRLRKVLAEAGFDPVHAQGFPMIRTPPLRPVEQTLFRELFVFLSTQAVGLELPAEDHHFWSKMSQVDAEDHPLQQPGFRYEALQWLFVGRNGDGLVLGPDTSR